MIFKGCCMCRNSKSKKTLDPKDMNMQVFGAEKMWHSEGVENAKFWRKKWYSKDVATKDEKVLFPQPESVMFELFLLRNFCILIHPLIHITSIIHFYNFSTLKILTSKFWMFIVVNACDDNGRNIQRKFWWLSQSF